MISPSACVWNRRYYRSVLGGGSRESSIRGKIPSISFSSSSSLGYREKENNKKKRCRHQGPLFSLPLFFCTELLLPRSRQSPSNALRSAQLNKPDGEDERRDGRHFWRKVLHPSGSQAAARHHPSHSIWKMNVMDLGTTFLLPLLLLSFFTWDDVEDRLNSLLRFPSIC